MIEEIAQEIKKRIGSRSPKTAIILGSGLGSLGAEIKDQVIIPYSEIKGFPVSSVKGHSGQLIIGSLEGHEVLCMQGRVHLYEGHKPQTINTFITAFRLLGVEQLIVTNAAGSLHKDMPAGSLMLIKDHINLNIPNPLIGPDDEKYGPRFPDMSNAYDDNIRSSVKELAAELGIKLYEGVYIMALGPCFDTSAEIRAFQILGADAVGMSTIPEVISAVHCGMKVLGISVITNLGTGLRDGAQSHQETLAKAEAAGAELALLVKRYLSECANG